MDTTQLLKGVLDLAVLAVLRDEDGYGYDILRRLRSAGLDEVGDCLEGDTIASDATKEVDLKIVKCTDAKAKYKVVGIKDGVARADALKDETTVCNDYIDAGAESVLWQGTDVTDGQALCLAPAK